ncbi:PfkB family carbohydrate kinase [Liquorilactobacillus nagelii]|uniref:PfkB family carbohydrate kinase n=1 Tax=Liquorilactobacillus nagelii TaxID=82688 RepID=UPI0039EB6172
MIVGIGDNCLDYYLPPINLRFAGGNVLNLVSNLQKHGAQSVYMGTVGNDESGNFIISTLCDNGIYTDHIRQVVGKTGLTEIALENGDYIIKSEKYGVSNTYELTDTTIDFLKENASLIHLSLTGKAAEIIPIIKDLNIPLSCDISYFYDNFDKEFWECLLPYLSYVFISAGAVKSQEKIYALIHEISSYGTKCITVTRGAKGCIAYCEGEFLSYHSILSPSKVVDPLGAGDAFISGFLFSTLSAGNKLKDYVETGSRWAAEACNHHGAW